MFKKMGKGVVLLMVTVMLALPAWAADYSAMSTEELAALRGTLCDVSAEEREAFHQEWLSRLSQMTPEERQEYAGRPDNAGTCLYASDENPWRDPERQGPANWAPGQHPSGWAPGHRSADGCAFRIADFPYEELSEAEMTSLRYMREEEKMARDVYQALFDLWGHPVFANIVLSETRHMACVLAMLEKYGLEDPAADDTPGVFSDPALQERYTQFVTEGSASLAEAFRAGAALEELDITGVNDALAQVDNADIQAVYQNLMRSSGNHFRAFVRQLEGLGETYTARYAEPEVLEEILSSSDKSGVPGAGQKRKNGEGCTSPCGSGKNCTGSGLNALNLKVGDSILLGRGGCGNGSGDGSGNGGNGPKDGSGNGRKSGTCINSAVDNAFHPKAGDGLLISRGGRGNGSGNGSGNGQKKGTCINSAADMPAGAGMRG
ncbi:hypothetical protein DENIS_2323 [Desulfonema ishimotonii]|uniref:DUF2202 domain-containing protein n=1 Tax=Desulfonema ishimotonii TaxID=45657 RepID=A0A401FWP1_9BACT|nr:DUF2202 domain-containing protein [Desulfonema ishimotonii]GBC61363.1 hypothetical protein DENIS_2323 [Desulfonema ishimotonii]